MTLTQHFSNHPAFANPAVRAAIPEQFRPQAPEVQPLMPVNLHSITIPCYWPGDEFEVFTWDSVDYVAAPRSVLKVPAKLRHQQDEKGRIIFNVELEVAPNGDPATIATALTRRYGHMGLVVLNADEHDEQRKIEARTLKYNPWRYQKALERIQRHRDACARSMRANTPAPIPPPELQMDEMFKRAMEGSGGSGDLSKRFVCQLDGSRWPTRSAAWAQVHRVDSSQVSNQAAVLDTMHELADPEVVAATGPKPFGSPAVPTGAAERPAIEALREEAKELKLRAFDEDISFTDEVKKGLASDELDILQIAIEDARTLIDGPSADRLGDR